MHGICRTPLTFRFRVTRLVSLLGGALLLEGGVEVVAGNGTGHVVSVPEEATHSSTNAKGNGQVSDEALLEHASNRLDSGAGHFVGFV